jgi:hypothetical protein
VAAKVRTALLWAGKSKKDKIRVEETQLSCWGRKTKNDGNSKLRQRQMASEIIFDWQGGDLGKWLFALPAYTRSCSAFSNGYTNRYSRNLMQSEFGLERSVTGNPVEK